MLEGTVLQKRQSPNFCDARASARATLMFCQCEIITLF